MQCLLLCRYSRLGASSRLRFLQYLPYLAEAGITVTTAPLLDDAYLTRLYAGQPAAYHRVAATYLARLRRLLGARRYDLVWIEKELFPLFPPWFEAALGALGVPYVVDYDDATFHSYDHHPAPAVRRLLGDKIDRVMRGAALVVAGNAYIRDRALRAGAPRVEVLPTVVDLAHYPPEGPPRPAAQEVFTVGWMGTPPTAKYLDLVRDALAALARTGPVRLVVVGAAWEGGGAFEVVQRPWREATEHTEIGRFDVGIMPLADGPWERGKCGYKLIQYLACSRPVVASPVGVNSEIVQPDVNGYLAGDADAWAAALERLRADAGRRARMGTAGRRLVESRYAVAVTAPRLAALLHAHARS